MGEPVEPEDRSQRMRWSDLYNLPGALTLSRLPLAWLCAQHKHDRDALALGLFVFVLTDVLDGPLARRWGLSSRAGVFADGWLDKFFLVAFAWSILVGGFVEGHHMLGWFIRELIQAVMVPFFFRRHVQAQQPLRQPSAAGKATTIVVTLGLGDRDFERQEVRVVLGDAAGALERGDRTVEIAFVETFHPGLDVLCHAPFAAV